MVRQWVQMLACLRLLTEGPQCCRKSNLTPVSVHCFVWCRCPGGQPSLVFDPRNPTPNALSDGTISRCLYNMLTVDLGSTAPEQCCELPRRQLQRLPGRPRQPH